MASSNSIDKRNVRRNKFISLAMFGLISIDARNLWNNIKRYNNDNNNNNNNNNNNDNNNNNNNINNVIIIILIM